MKVHQYIEKFVNTKPWEIVDFEARSALISGLNVVVTFKQLDTPTQWAFGNDFAAGYMSDSDPLVFSHDTHHKFFFTDRLRNHHAQL